MSADQGPTSWGDGVPPLPDSLLNRTPLLAELLDLPSLAGVVEGFAGLHGMGVQVIDAQGACLAGTEGRQGAFCAHVTSGKQDGEGCAARAPLGSGLHSVACPSGVRYLVLQVRWEGSELGRVVFGPFAPEVVAALPERMDVVRAPGLGSPLAAAAAYFSQVLEALMAVGHRSWLASRIQLESAGEIRRELEVRDARMSSLQGRLREMDRLQSSFLGTVSHELRTPLASIIAYSELLSEGITGQLNPEQIQCVQSITEMGRTLLDLITSILDISQLEAGKLRLAFAPVDMAEVVVSAVSSVTPQSRRKGLKLEVVLPELRQPRVLADKGRLYQVLVNLLANALKFTPEGHVRVRLSEVGPQEELGGQGYRFCVEDTGVGIRQDQLERIFQSFYQVDSSSTREFGGVGLGLSIVKRFVEGHGGKVLVTSQPGQGSCFIAVLPSRPPQVGESGVHVLPPLPEPDRF
ncbi:HAMP domain-containing sensor histidine kinase [Stigmatella sp. ncwal1]|uniref:histidine kinase n=1 Tax=Stigmatella ashevillensis TaxID=2995309 RepID=A0ABT5DH79_9BACT|nr:HAMP domain-containing sensor histidine kinase [Stigmatella ashevillena]MDC0713024.1 HAMP domain-containing sensor histidine kinase [Stigmatella ashevillena]